jgi:DNA-nicking Smr family endonuclease
MVRRLAQDEKLLWARVMATVKPISPVSVSAPKLVSPPGAVAVAAQPRSASKRAVHDPVKAKTATPLGQNTLDATWDRRIQKGATTPDVTVDLHGQGLSAAYHRLDHALDQAIHQKLRVLLLVTGQMRRHDRASGEGRGAIAAVVRDWLAASRHAPSILAVRQAHPRHGGGGALYIILKRNR